MGFTTIFLILLAMLPDILFSMQRPIISPYAKAASNREPFFIQRMSKKEIEKGIEGAFRDEDNRQH